MKFLSKNPQETQQIARDFLKNLKPNTSAATIVGLYGDLGSGKTTFTQFIAKELGIEETVASPTFVIEKIYKLNNHPHFTHLIHIDAYRLESGAELEVLGWRDITSESGNLIFLEWPEKVEEILPVALEKMYFKFIDENTREIDIIE